MAYGLFQSNGLQGGKSARLYIGVQYYVVIGYNMQVQILMELLTRPRDTHGFDNLHCHACMPLVSGGDSGMERQSHTVQASPGKCLPGTLCIDSWGPAACHLFSCVPSNGLDSVDCKYDYCKETVIIWKGWWSMYSCMVATVVIEYEWRLTSLLMEISTLPTNIKPSKELAS